MPTSTLDFALSLADTADTITTERFRARDLRVATKPDRTPVTEADRAVEAALSERIRATHPDDAVLGEEYGTVGDPTGRCWVIDPIDATANYLRGVPVWATLIGLLDRGRPTVGVVSAPAMGRRWWSDGSSAWTRDVDGSERRLQVSDVGSLADASISYSDRVGWRDGELESLVSGTWRTRAFGDFYSHVLVAEGCVDVAAEPALSPWDVVALLPIIASAGGRATGISGGLVLNWSGTGPTVPDGMMTTNGLLHVASVERCLSADTWSG